MHFPHLTALYEGLRTDDLIVCHIDNALAVKLGARRGRVLLSHDTMRKQRANHPDLTLDHYRVLPFVLTQGEFRRDHARAAVVIYVDTIMFNTTFRAYVKATGDARLYIVSLNKMRDRQAQKERRRRRNVIREHQ